jgi:hypothetical protein
MAESFTLEEENPHIKAEVKGSIFNEAAQNLESTPIGDPLSSAVASILARTTRHPVTIESIKIQDDTMVTEYMIHGSEPEEEPEEGDNSVA